MLGTTIQNVVCCQEFVHPCAIDWLVKGMCLDFQQEQEICHFSTVSSPVLGSTQLLLQLVQGCALSRGRVAGA